MGSWKLDNGVGALTVTLVLVAALTAGQAVAGWRSQNGSTFVFADKLRKATKFGPLTSSVVVPPDMDLSLLIESYCWLRAVNRNPDDLEDFVGVRRVKAKWETHAYVMDHRDGSLEVLDVGEGLLKTTEFGADVLMPIPPEVVAAIPAGSLESGDVSVLLVTEAEITKGRKINEASLQCLVQEGSFPQGGRGRGGTQ